MKYVITFKKKGKKISRTLSAESMQKLIDEKIKCDGFCYATVMLILMESGIYKGTHAGNAVTIQETGATS